MKTKISSFLLVATLLLSGFGSVQRLSAQTTTDPNALTPDEAQVFSTYIDNLLSLEPTPPQHGKAVGITAEAEASILNLLAVDQDYFGLFTAQIGSFIDDTPTQDPTTGALHHHYTPKAGQKNRILGYLACLNKHDAKKAISSAAQKNNGTTSYTYFNDVNSGPQYLMIDLESDFLSQQVVDSLYAAYYAPGSSDYIWMDLKGFDGTSLQHSTIPQNVFTFELYIGLDSNGCTAPAYSQIYHQHDPAGNYTK